MSELKKITDIVDFNPKGLQKGQQASFIEMALCLLMEEM